MAIKGRPLRSGGTIGVPAPASPYHNRSEILRGVEWWQGKGYRVKLGEGVYERDAYVAGDPKTRANDINALFADPDVDVVQCLTGGYGSAQTLPYLDFDIISSNPKPFVGYSDITALHNALREKTRLVTFYGPGLMSMNAEDRDKDSKAFLRKHLLNALTSTDALGSLPKNPDDDYVRTLTPGKVTGELVGGCLWLLGQSIGTPWEVSLAGKIFFFEDYELPPWYADGLLNQMSQAGMLNDVIGVVVGDLEKCDWREDKPEFPQTLSIEDVLERYIEPLGVPAIYRLPMGHGKYLATTPLGVTATLDADNRNLTIDEPALQR
jgi:muramoyltetrapeptide carboxypeptidase